MNSTGYRLLQNAGMSDRDHRLSLPMSQLLHDKDDGVKVTVDLESGSEVTSNGIDVTFKVNVYRVPDRAMAVCPSHRLHPLSSQVPFSQTVGVHPSGLLQDLSFSIPSNQIRGETAYLLKGASGSFSGGQLVALLGPSGSGKTVGILGISTLKCS